MLKKFFWEGVSSCLFTVLGLCMMAAATQPRLFGKCTGHNYCSETTNNIACVYDNETGKCKDGGCHRQNNEADCDTCVCTLESDKNCYCK